MKEISVLGTAVTDYTLRESLRCVQKYFENGVLNTICYLSTDLLIKARDDEELKAVLQNTDLLIPGNAEIIHAGGIKSRSREKEVEGNFFLRQILKSFAHDKKRIFLIASTQEDLVALREQLLSIESKLTFFGSFSYNDLPGTDDLIINEINSVLPDVIMSRFDSPAQEKLMDRSRKMANARLWISLQPDSVITPQTVPVKRNMISAFFNKYIFRRAVNKYDKDSETE